MISDMPRVVAKIDVDAITHNYKEIKKSIPRYTGIMAVVKADAYGHGAVEIAKILQREEVDYLAVAITMEGAQLRDVGITTPILVLGYTPAASVGVLIENDLTQTIFSYEMAKYISYEASKLEKKVKIHIKVDTGMGRIGFLPHPTSIEEIVEINKLPNIEIEGIYTHFSSADEEDRTYTKKQNSIFNGFLKELEQVGIEVPIVHAANSAAIIMHPNTHSNMVRLGICLYGHYPSEVAKSYPVGLIPTMSLKTQVVHVKKVPKGQSIGYNRKYTTKHMTKIATIPIGYADGYSRGLSNKGRVLIRGEYAPIIGNICMDQFMVDVTHINYVAVGDEVVLFGKQKGNEIAVEEIADILNTINYEIICMIGKRIPRIYV
ncbi:MAG TPA: alanine racemase [Epulopiscium sp.]|nr:alanine racemase [Candidatus Epulonipiscium sp.]